MVHRRASFLLAVAVLGFACGCASLRDWRPFARRTEPAGCLCSEFGDAFGEGPVLEGAGPMVVQPGDPMAPAVNGACANGQPSVVQPPKLIPQPQAANPTPYAPSKNIR